MCKNPTQSRRYRALIHGHTFARAVTIHTNGANTSDLVRVFAGGGMARLGLGDGCIARSRTSGARRRHFLTNQDSAAMSFASAMSRTWSPTNFQVRRHSCGHHSHARIFLSPRSNLAGLEYSDRDSNRRSIRPSPNLIWTLSDAARLRAVRD